MKSSFRFRLSGRFRRERLLEAKGFEGGVEVHREKNKVRKKDMFKERENTGIGKELKKESGRK